MIKKNSKTGVVTFTFDEKSDGPVYLVGDFNKWDANAMPLAKRSSKWVAEIKLKPGEYQFKYLAGGKWYNDYHADKYASSPFGGDNSVVVIS